METTAVVTKKRGNPFNSGRAIGQKNKLPAGERHNLTLQPSTVSWYENHRQDFEESGFETFEDNNIAAQIKSLSGLLTFISKHCTITLKKSLCNFPVFPCTLSQLTVMFAGGCKASGEASCKCSTNKPCKVFNVFSYSLFLNNYNSCAGGHQE